jgi:antitoxin HicB
MAEGTEKGYLGTSLEEFLKEQEIYEEAVEHAIKRVLAYQIEQEMKEKGINKVEMAKRLQTSRSQLDRLLDPENENITLAALSRAAQAVGRTLHLELR